MHVPLVFDVFRLSCLDYLVWLRSGKYAALRLNCNQATVSRNAKSVAEFLDLDACKLEGEWRLDGDLNILNAERNVHQAYRWAYGKSLRIDAIYGVGAPCFQALPDAWVCGPSNFLNVIHPLELLKSSILDVWMACYPDVPSDDDELVVIHLTRYPYCFLVDPQHPLLESKGELAVTDLQNFPVVALPDGSFPKIQHHLKGLGLQRSSIGAARHEVSRWEGRTKGQLTISYGSVHTLGNFHGTKVPLPFSTGLNLGDSLVVKRCFAGSDYFRQLLLSLVRRPRCLSSANDELEFCSDSLDWLSTSSVDCF